jgi:hypothetical protein
LPPKPSAPLPSKTTVMKKSVSNRGKYKNMYAYAFHIY